MKSWVYRILEKEKILSHKNKYSIGILGLAYKENTNSVKNSPTLNLLRKLKNNKITIYDPAAKLEKKIKKLKTKKKKTPSPEDKGYIDWVNKWGKKKKTNKVPDYVPQ